jgi:hypothetical protein
MRFKATNENLTIHVSLDETAGCIRSVVRCLVPQHTRKVYLFTKSRPSFLVEDADVTLVGANDLPSNFLQSFRIILHPGELVVVSGQTHFTRDQWRSLAESVEAYAA